ncbi:MAG: Holliday junction branch migration protein RuvA [Pseudomonadota bacterium]
MIGQLSGRLTAVASDHVMLSVGGVGYLVFCNERTLAQMPPVGEPLSLFTDLLVREDLLQLFGFMSLAEKEWHRLLMGVQGVGAKASMAILGTLGPDGVSRAIAMGDWGAVKAAKGIGPKTAQKVVIDLKDKAPDVMAMLSQAAKPSADEDVLEPVTKAEPSQAPAKQSSPQAGQGAAAQADALSALRNLGYAPTDAAAAVAGSLAEEPELGLDALIRAALKRLAPKG